jgi:hypothetical protein
VPLRAPVIGQVSGRILHHPHANLAPRLRPPVGRAGFTRMLGSRDSAPIGSGQRKRRYFHRCSVANRRVRPDSFLAQADGMAGV